MNTIIDKIPYHEIFGELTNEDLLRKTKNGSNEVYIISAVTHPKTMREIGRLRELSFRDAGAGSGKDCDIDQDDLCPNGYQQLIVWDPQEREIIGGYRFVVLNQDNQDTFSTRHYFDLSQEFKESYLPYTIELGRSFIQPKYQGKNGNRKGIFALDNLWDGLGALLVRNPHVKYLFGKVTMYKTMNQELRDMLYTLLHKYFVTNVSLMTPKAEIAYNVDYDRYIHLFDGLEYAEAFKLVIKKAKNINSSYPPLFAAYANLSSTMSVFGTVINHNFGEVLETGIMITITDVNADKYNRYVSSFLEE